MNMPLSLQHYIVEKALLRSVSSEYDPYFGIHLIPLHCEVQAYYG